MQLIFKQRLFSWFDSYDVYDAEGNTLFSVKGQLSWGHCLKIYDAYGRAAGMVKEKVLSFLPRYEIYEGDRYMGCISKELTFVLPKFKVDFNGWRMDGDFFEWDYRILRPNGSIAAAVSKQIWNLTDTYVIDIADPADALHALMLVIAVDAEKCSRN